jgi:hypothetical protein
MIPSDLGETEGRGSMAQLWGKWISSDEPSAWLRDVDAAGELLALCLEVAAPHCSGKVFRHLLLHLPLAHLSLSELQMVGAVK